MLLLWRCSVGAPMNRCTCCPICGGDQSPKRPYPVFPSNPSAPVQREEGVRVPPPPTGSPSDGEPRSSARDGLAVVLLWLPVLFVAGGVALVAVHC